MEKINFENLPSTNTPINANNLNQIQTNVENAINTQTVTTAGTNLDDYKTDGTYYFSSNHTPTNIPAGSNGFLKVLKGDCIKQIWYRHGTANTNDYQTYVRTFTSNSWSNWKQFQMVEDTGWITATLNSAFKPYNDTSSYTPEYRKVGKSVEIRGVIAPTKEIESGGSANIFTLPSAFRPSKHVYTLCQASGRRVWMLTVNPNGTVSFARHGKGEYEATDTGAWLPFNANFLID